MTVDVLDGGMVTIAIFVYNFFHPGCLLETSEKERYAVEKEVSLDAWPRFIMEVAQFYSIYMDTRIKVISG